MYKILHLPMSLYIHFPWCLSKCPYCDFNSYVLRDNCLIDVYGECLLSDLAEEAKQYYGCKLESIYFGGGTPSLLTPKIIGKILDAIYNIFVCPADLEITIEANPGTIDLALCQGFKAAGINRLSLGVQSFCDKNLKNLGRLHSSTTAQQGIKALKIAGFTNFNLDLMYGLPAQTATNAARDIQMALDFAPSHISWYQLTLDTTYVSKSCFAVLPQHDELWNIQQCGYEILQQVGYVQYEVSAYCQSLKNRCQHNLNYWCYGDYIGIGAGAHGKITFDDYSIKHYVKIPQPYFYLQAKNFMSSEEFVAREKIPLDFMLNALRLYEPIGYDLFWQRTGCKIDVIKRQLESAINQGFIKLHRDAIVTTELGRNFLDNLLEIFCP